MLAVRTEREGEGVKARTERAVERVIPRDNIADEDFQKRNDFEISVDSVVSFLPFFNFFQDHTPTGHPPTRPSLKQTLFPLPFFAVFGTHSLSLEFPRENVSRVPRSDLQSRGRAHSE